ncbi:MAG: hypothetical protein JW388_1713 [Nitrospira sp.]|nr:hypothetical protein [Nitrospira sp.]
MQHPFDLHGGHGRTGQRRQQHTSQGIANSRPEPALIGLRRKPAERFSLGILIDFHPHRDLKVLHRFNHESPFISSSTQSLHEARAPQ